MGLTMAGATALGAGLQGVSSLIGLPIQGYLQKKSEERQDKYNKENMEIQQDYARENALMQQGFTRENMELTKQHNKELMQNQFELNEKGAVNAHKRNLDLYHQTQSTQAKVAEMEKAGLSIGLLNGTPSQGGASSGGTASVSGQGVGTVPGAGVQTPAMGITQAQTLNIMDTMNTLGKTMADVAKTISETKILEQEEKIAKHQEYITRLEKLMKERQWNDNTTEYIIKHSSWVDKNSGNQTSLTEMAMNSNSFDDFVKGLEYNDGALKTNMESEYGRQILHNIYNTAHQLKIDNLGMLYNEKNIKFQSDILKAMENEDFAKMNAKAQAGYLKANIATTELTATQKEAWNNVLNKIENENIKNGLIVLAMMINQMAGSWHMPNMSTYNTNNYVTNQ